MNRKNLVFGVSACGTLAALSLFAVLSNSAKATVKPEVGINPGNILHRSGLPLKPTLPGDQLAAFSEGCFWGSENVFRHVKGVLATAVGYTGGHVANPTYEEVCSHMTGHCETVLMEYNPKIVSYKQLLADFWNSHDPTQTDGQGPDLGSNYRSAIWAFNEKQYKEAIASEIATQKLYSMPVVTQIAPIGPFWLAEQYHQQYDEKNGVAACPVFLRSQPSKKK